MLRSFPSWGSGLATGLMAFGLMACNAGKSDREKVSGTEIKGLNGSSDGSVAPGGQAQKPQGSTDNGNDQQAPNNTSTGTSSTGGNSPVPAPSVPTPSGPAPSQTPPPNPTPPPPTLPNQPGPQAPKAVSLEECSAQKKAWPAVVNQKQAVQCGDALVEWCCTRGEVKARFPTLAATLEERFAKHVDTEQFVLYHCSFDPLGSPQKGPKYTLHFGKIVEPQVFYQPLHIYDLAPVTPVSPQNPCPPAVGTDALKTKLSPSPDYATTIKPIIEAKCGGTACHSAATSLGARLDFSVPANLKSANQAFLFSMPPANSGKQPMTAQELKAITDFMSQP